jgi:hypothetical protein
MCVPIPRLFEYLENQEGKGVHTWDDNQWVSVSHSKNHPNFGYLLRAFHGMSHQP